MRHTIAWYVHVNDGPHSTWAGACSAAMHMVNPAFRIHVSIILGEFMH